MIKFIITDENFDSVMSQQEKTYAGIVTKLHKLLDTVSITVNTLAPFAIYKWEAAGHFAIQTNLISEYITKFGYELTYTPVESKYANKKNYVDKARNVDLQKITHWQTVIINKQGNVRTILPKKKVYTIPLNSKRGVKYLLRWLKKYLLIAKRLIKENKFIPTLTGGLDTRILTWFWRDLYHGDKYYLRAVKNDGKNNVAKGQVEIEFATQVLNKLGKQLTRIEINQRWISFSGFFARFLISSVSLPSVSS